MDGAIVNSPILLTWPSDETLTLLALAVGVISSHLESILLTCAVLAMEWLWGFLDWLANSSWHTLPFRRSHRLWSGDSAIRAGPDWQLANLGANNCLSGPGRWQVRCL